MSIVPAHFKNLDILVSTFNVNWFEEIADSFWTEGNGIKHLAPNVLHYTCTKNWNQMKTTYNKSLPEQFQNHRNRNKIDTPNTHIQYTSTVIKNHRNKLNIYILHTHTWPLTFLTWYSHSNKTSARFIWQNSRSLWHHLVMQVFFILTICTLFILEGPPTFGMTPDSVTISDDTSVNGRVMDIQITYFGDFIYNMELDYDNEFFYFDTRLRTYWWHLLN